MCRAGFVIVLVIPVADPLPDIPGHIIRAIRTLPIFIRATIDKTQWLLHISFPKFANTLVGDSFPRDRDGDLLRVLLSNRHFTFHE